MRLGSGGWIRTSDLLGMNQTDSYFPTPQIGSLNEEWIACNRPALTGHGSPKVHPRFAFKHSEYLLTKLQGFQRCPWVQASVYAGVAFKQQCVLGQKRRVKAGKRQAPAFHLYWQGRVSPLAVASPSAPAFALGLFYWGNGLDLLDQYLCPWVLWVKSPVRMALLHLTVVLVDQPLHQVEDQ